MEVSCSAASWRIEAEEAICGLGLEDRISSGCSLGIEGDAEVVPVRIFAGHLQHKAFVELLAERLAPCDQVSDPAGILGELAV